MRQTEKDMRENCICSDEEGKQGPPKSFLRQLKLLVRKEQYELMTFQNPLPAGAHFESRGYMQHQWQAIYQLGLFVGGCLSLDFRTAESGSEQQHIKTAQLTSKTEAALSCWTSNFTLVRVSLSLTVTLMLKLAFQSRCLITDEFRPLVLLLKFINKFPFRQTGSKPHQLDTFRHSC